MIYQSDGDKQLIFEKFKIFLNLLERVIWFNKIFTRHAWILSYEKVSFSDTKIMPLLLRRE
jgi:hypothetical protein